MDARFAFRTCRAGVRATRSMKRKGWGMRWLPAISAFTVGCEDSPEKGVGPDGLSTPSAAVALAGAATQLAFTVQPSKASAGATISPAVVVTALDAAGRKTTNFNGAVTVAIATSPGKAFLVGTTTVTAVAGKATFSNLSIGQAGTGYTLRAASATLTTATSGAFTITPGPAKQLAFTVHPSNTTVGATISPPVQVIARDAFGNAVPGFKGSVTVAIASGVAGATLAGTSTVPAVSGVATFSTLSVDTPGKGYTLRATSGTLLSGTSGSFTITSLGFWTTHASMPAARAYAGVAVISGILYAVGGQNNAVVNLATVEAYDPGTDAWTARASMPTARLAPGVAVIDGILYAVGGSDGGPYLPTLEAYDPATNTWTTKAPMPTARAYAGVAAIDGILYAVGGVGAGYLATVEAYNPATDTWTTKASMPTARLAPGVAVINGTLYAVGGFDNTGTFLATVEAYDPATDTWTSKPSMPTARVNVGVAAIDGILYAVGGQFAPGGYLPTVEAYDPRTTTWTTKAPMPTARTNAGVAAINGILYAVGGYGNTGHMATVEAFHP